MNEMKESKEVSWERLFACEIAKPKIEWNFAKKCTCGNRNCKRAKHIRCVCGCHGIAHGIEQRKGMSPLDEPLGLDGLTVTKEAPAPLGDLALDLEFSGRLESP